MSPAETYRAEAAELLAKAANEGHAQGAASLEHLANLYVRLAEQADRNSAQDLWAEFGPPPRLGGEQI